MGEFDPVHGAVRRQDQDIKPDDIFSQPDTPDNDKHHNICKAQEADGQPDDQIDPLENLPVFPGFCGQLLHFRMMQLVSGDVDIEDHPLMVSEIIFVGKPAEGYDQQVAE